MVGQVQKLGPLGIPQKFEEWDKEMEQFAAQVAETEAATGGAGAGHNRQTPAQTNEMEAAHA
jgi:hypothetical protein